MFDVAVVGGGPAGSTCSAMCARAGLRTLLLEREKFPREKVCGDCLNPACWSALDGSALMNMSGSCRTEDWSESSSSLSAGEE